MALFTKYRATFTEQGVSHQLDLLVDVGSDPGVTTISCSDLRLRFSLANSELLYGSLSYLLSMSLFVSDTIAEDIASTLAVGPGLLRCRLTRGSVVIFTGLVEPYQITRSVDTASSYKITLSAADYQSAHKKISVSRVDVGIETVYTWLFERILNDSTSGGVWHAWRPNGAAPSVAVPTGMLGTEFDPAIASDEKIFDLNQKLAQLFQFVYGWSVSLGYPALTHSERFLASGTKVTGATKTATTVVVQGVVTTLAEGTITYANGGYGYFRVLADSVALNPATSDNLIGKEFDINLDWDLTSTAASDIKGLTYRDGTASAYTNATYVDPADNAFNPDLDEAIKFVVRSTFRYGNKLFFVDIANRLLDPLFCFWLVLPTSSHLVRARYGELDLLKPRVQGAELVQLSETGTCVLTVTVTDQGGLYTDGIFKFSDIDTGEQYQYDIFVSAVGPFTLRAPYGTWSLGFYVGGTLNQSLSVTLSTATDSETFDLV